MSGEAILRPMVKADLATVLTWRNHPEVRSMMFTQNVISCDDHARWFEKASTDPSRTLLIFERDKAPLGYNSLVRLRGSDVAEWGYYLSPEAPRGTGSEMGRKVLEFAFDRLELHKVFAETLGFNDRGQKFNLKLGFREEGRLRNQFAIDGRRTDVICFGLLASEWRSASGRG